MNTKSAVILMIGLLGSPVAYNFTQPVWENATSGDVPLFFNQRTGEWFTPRGGGIIQPGQALLTDLERQSCNYNNHRTTL